MKTISTGTMTMRFNEAPLVEGVLTKRAVAAWLPAPPARQTSISKASANLASKPSQSLWIPLENESLGQKLIGGLLVIAALATIGYGFSSLIDMVQNWAAFNSWVGQIL